MSESNVSAPEPNPIGHKFPHVYALVRYCINTVNRYQSSVMEWHGEPITSLASANPDAPEELHVFHRLGLRALAEICCVAKEVEDLYEPADAHLVKGVTEPVVVLLTEYRDYLWDRLQWLFAMELEDEGSDANLDDDGRSLNAFPKAYKDIVQADLAIAALQELQEASTASSSVGVPNSQGQELLTI